MVDENQSRSIREWLGRGRETPVRDEVEDALRVLNRLGSADMPSLDGRALGELARLSAHWFDLAFTEQARREFERRRRGRG